MPGLGLTDDFFAIQGPPESPDAIYSTSSFLNVFSKLDLDSQQRRRGNVRFIVGSRGSGKSTCLEYLRARLERRERGLTCSFDPGLYMAELLGGERNASVQQFLRKLAEAVSGGKHSDVAAVVAALQRLPEGKVGFLFIDNLDRLSRGDDLEFIRYLFQKADPTLQALAKKLVIVITAAPEWKELMANPKAAPGENDLSYLNFGNHVELKPLSRQELEGMLSARLQTVGKQLNDVFDKEFIDCLYTAAAGHPRAALEILDTINGSSSILRLPATGDDFKEGFPEVLHKGALERLRQVAKQSGKVSWGLNNLASYFEASDKRGVKASQAVDALAEIYSTRPTQVRMPNALMVNVARIGYDGRWDFYPQVRQALDDWVEETNLAPSVLLTAFSLAPFRVSNTVIEEYVPFFHEALDRFPAILALFAKAQSDYVFLKAPSGARREPAELIRAALDANQNLLVSIYVIFYGVDPLELRNKLADIVSLEQASKRLQDEISLILEGAERSYPYSADIAYLIAARLDSVRNPTVATHWTEDRLTQVCWHGVNAFEGTIRSITPRFLEGIKDRHKEIIQHYRSQGQGIGLAFAESPEWQAAPVGFTGPKVGTLVRTVAALSNSRGGGTVIIGLDARGSARGVVYFGGGGHHTERDRYREQIIATLRAKLGPAALLGLEMDWLTVEGTDLFRIKVRPGHQAIRFDDGARSLFLVRTEGGNEELEAEAQIAYLRTRFAGQS